MIADAESGEFSGRFAIDATHQRNESALLRLAAATSRCTDARVLADALAMGVVNAARAGDVDVFLADDERRELVLAARTREAPGDAANAPPRVRIDGRGVVPMAGRTRRLQWQSSETGEVTVAIPLVSERGLHGVLAVYGHVHFGADDLEDLRALADIAAGHLARLALTENVHEHERFERSLRATARHFRACFDQTFQLAWMLTADGTVVDVNASALETTHRPARATLGRPLWEAAPWEDGVDAPSTLREKVARAARGERVRCEMALGCDDPKGSSSIVDLSIKPVTDEQGHVAFLLAEARDVTARKRAEDQREALAAQVDHERQWLRTVIEHAPVGILLFEHPSDGRVIVNPLAAEILGCRLPGAQASAQEIVGLLDGGMKLVEDVLGGEVVLAREFRVRADGPSPRDVTLLLSGAPIRSARTVDDDGDGDGRDRGAAGGAVTGAVILCEDISALKALERLREEWTSVIAHDLRQPLHAIQLHASRLARAEAREATTAGDGSHAGDGTPRSGPLRHILASTRLLERMISELWDMAALDAGKLSLDVAVTDVATTMRVVLDRMECRMGGHALRLHAVDEPLNVHADPERVEQILWNLICNADKYGFPETDIVVRVARDDACAIVSVTNEGEGIDDDAKARIFDRFHRLTAARKNGPRGLGLGLYISRQLTEAQGGRIWCDSIKGERTTFSFTVPLA